MVVSSGTEDRILQNALKHFCDFGYTGTSVRDITAASEVTKPTLYYYFKNKEELFTRLASSCFDIILGKLKEASSKTFVTFESNVLWLFDAYEEVFNSHPDSLKFIYSITVSPQRGSPEVGVKDFASKIEHHVQEIVSSAVSRNECSPQKAETVQVLLTSLFAFHTTCLLTDVDSCKKVRRAVSVLCACAKDEEFGPRAV